MGGEGVPLNGLNTTFHCNNWPKVLFKRATIYHIVPGRTLPLYEVLNHEHFNSTFGRFSSVQDMDTDRNTSHECPTDHNTQ